MNLSTKKRLSRFFKILFLVYIIVGAILYFGQELFLFHPKPLLPGYQFSFQQPFLELNMVYGKDNLSIIQFKAPAQRKGLILFFHGNMENVEHYKTYPSFFTKNNYEVWMIDYPGFGKTTGKRTEKIMMEQALFLYGLANKEIKEDSIIIYGKSIGTGVASYVAANRKCKRLILETPYWSIESLFHHYAPVYPVSIMTKYSFPIHRYLKSVFVPVTIFHGTNDGVVPYEEGKKLADENKNVQFITIEKGNHNDLSSFPVFHQILDSLLRQ